MEIYLNCHKSSVLIHTQELILYVCLVPTVELREGLDRHLAVEFPANVRLLRSATRGGLIRARLLGTRAAQAPVIVCMDSHMEVEERW